MNSVEKLTVDAIAYGGEAVGRLASGEVCFLRGALPGEEVELVLTERKKRFARARVLKRLSTSPHRITPACPLAGECPGCSFQHCTYELELEWKQKQFERFLNGFPGERLPIFPSPERFFWRNRLKLACEKGVAGYRGFDNKTLLPVSRCLLAKEAINNALTAASIPEEGALFFRSTPEWTGEVSSLESEYLTETLSGAGTFKVPAKGFFQTNIPVAAELCSRVVRTLQDLNVTKMLELFCGAGIFSIAAARQIPDLESFGIELAANSIEAALINAQINGVEKRCSFLAGDASLFNSRSKYGCLLVDPPRSGLESKVIKKILKSGIPHLIYISCGPDTLRRDLALLAEKYEVKSAGALDMFPCTAHFETFAILSLLK